MWADNGSGGSVPVALEHVGAVDGVVLMPGDAASLFPIKEDGGRGGVGGKWCGRGDSGGGAG